MALKDLVERWRITIGQEDVDSWLNRAELDSGYDHDVKKFLQDHSKRFGQMNRLLSLPLSDRESGPVLSILHHNERKGIIVVSRKLADGRYQIGAFNISNEIIAKHKFEPKTYQKNPKEKFVSTSESPVDVNLALESGIKVIFNNELLQENKPEVAMIEGRIHIENLHPHGVVIFETNASIHLKGDSRDELP
jgi:hypothetical protein